ncbi:MAG TPA: hypothetical protein VEC13_02850, partial [Candidatus Paceibacterota bacterium]|nr:hypothetical protein [Candidatus Paceibacterota bacterium]
ELSFTYFATSSPFQILNVLPAPQGTSSGDEVAQKALLFANATGMNIKFNKIVLSDAEAIEQKVSLAKEMGLKGIAIFKIDNGEDKDLWELFE